jgi:hypothetical protein
MMTNLVDFPERDAPLDPLIGPFKESRVVVDGRMIPNLTGFHEGGETFLVVDHRFSVAVPREYAYSVAWLVAQGMAIASGYPHLGAESKVQPFAPKAQELSGVPKNREAAQRVEEAYFRVKGD